MLQKLKLSIIMMMASTPLVFSQPVQGNYQGSFQGDWSEVPVRVQIIGMSWEDYDAQFFIGDDGNQVVVKGKTANDRTLFNGEVELTGDPEGIYTVTGEVIKGKFSGAFRSSDGGAQFSFERVILGSPTMGKEPPDNAIVLMPSGQDTETFLDNWHAQLRWVVQNDGTVRISNSSVVSKEKLGDGTLHVEFMCPYMPNDRGQARGNSGVYLMGRYEVQVLDNFGWPTADNHCGGIYQKATPLVNACRPPGEWQTYDLEFTAPKFDDNGNKTANARLTAYQNGILIHDDIELDGVTGGAISGQEAAEGPLMLQDHNDSLTYRNVWFAKK